VASDIQREFGDATALITSAVGMILPQQSNCKHFIRITPQNCFFIIMQINFQNENTEQTIESV
jgi:hypothetical protein